MESDSDANFHFEPRHCEVAVTTLCRTFSQAYANFARPEVNSVQWIRSTLCYSICDYVLTNSLHGDFSLNNIVLCDGRDIYQHVLGARLVDPEFVTTPTSSSKNDSVRAGTLPFIAIAVLMMKDSESFTRDLCHELESVWWALCLLATGFDGFEKQPYRTKVIALAKNRFAIQIDTRKKRKDCLRNNLDWWLFANSHDAETIIPVKCEIAWREELKVPVGLSAVYNPYLRLLSDMHKELFGGVFVSCSEQDPDWEEISTAMQACQLGSAVRMLALMDEYLATYGKSVPYAGVKVLQDMLQQDRDERLKLKQGASPIAEELLQEISILLAEKASASSVTPEQEAAAMLTSHEETSDSLALGEEAADVLTVEEVASQFLRQYD